VTPQTLRNRWSNFKYGIRSKCHSSTRKDSSEKAKLSESNPAQSLSKPLLSFSSSPSPFPPLSPLSSLHRLDHYALTTIYRTLPLTLDRFGCTSRIEVALDFALVSFLLSQLHSSDQYNHKHCHRQQLRVAQLREQSRSSQECFDCPYFHSFR